MRKSVVVFVFAFACLVVAFCFATAVGSSAQTLTTLYNFDFNHGRDPESPLVQGLNGSFYGATLRGGESDDGVVYGITSLGALHDLHSFCDLATTGCSPLNGFNPHDSLILGHDGNFYGITYEGGANSDTNICQFGCGTVFKITPGGTVSTVYSFCVLANCTDGATPVSLIQGADGNFYGATDNGGVNTENCTLVLNLCGTLFKLTPQGVLTTLYNFCSQYSNQSCSDGGSPEPGLVQASNGKFYGTTLFGGTGSSPNGVIFEITPSGTYSVLHTFKFPQGDSFSGLMQANNGDLFGTLAFGGTHLSGSVYRITLSGQFTTVYSFCAETGCPDGNDPYGGLVQGSDGNLYGTTLKGGLISNSNCSTGCGTIFSLSPQGKFTSLYSFCSQANCADGYLPGQTMTQGTDGKFYGTTSTVDGTIFSFDVGLGPYIEALPGTGKVGRFVKILGNSLTGTTGVSFNGTPAAFTVVADTLVSVTVPAGATTGTIELTTSSATLSTKVPFVVTP